MGINNSVQFFKRNRDGHIRKFMRSRFRCKAGIRSVQGWYVSKHTYFASQLQKAAAEHRRSGGDEKGYVKWRLCVRGR